MKKRIIGLVLILLILASAVFIYSSLNTSKDVSINNIIKKLCSKELDGRLTGTEGNQKTENYLAEMLETIGIGAYSDSGYKIGFKFDFFNPQLQIHSFVIEHEGGEKLELQYGTDYMGQGVFENLKIEYPITFDIDSPDIENSIAAIADADNISKQYKKAKAVLIKKSDFKKYIMISGGTPIIQVSEETFEKIKGLKSPIAKLEITSPKNNITVNNIAGKLAGASTDTAIVLSAHFDHVGSYSEKIYYGASDNASGAAVVLDIAQKLKKHSEQKQLNKNIIVALFNGEESGLHGSKSFVNQVKKQYKNIININIDFVGAKNGGTLIISGDKLISNTLMSDLNSYLKEKSYDCDLGGQNYTSDHLSFSDNHIISLNIGQQNAEIIHTLKDTIDNIDIGYLEKLSNDIYSFILSIDSMEYTHDCSNDAALLDEYYNQIIEEEQEKLGIGEYKVIQIEAALVVCFRDSLGYYFRDFEEFQVTYPGLGIPEHIGDFKAQDIRAMHDFNFPISAEGLELNKVYKLDVTFDNLKYLGLPYLHENKMMGFNIFVGNNAEKEKTDKQIKVDNITFNVIYDESTKQLQGFYTSKTIGGKTVSVDIMMYDIIEKAKDKKSKDIKKVNWFDGSYERAVEFMSSNHFGDIVENIYKNFIEK